MPKTKLSSTIVTVVGALLSLLMEYGLVWKSRTRSYPSALDFKFVTRSSLYASVKNSGPVEYNTVVLFL